MNGFCASVALLALTPPEAADDFFPLNPGSTWVYSDTGGAATVAQTDRVGDPATIGGQLAVPIVTTVGGREDGRTYYRVTGGTVELVAFDAKRPLTAPYPILKATGKRETWTYTGEAEWLSLPVPLSLKGTSRPAGFREVLGERRETLEVTIEATVGAEDFTGVRSRQVAIYARGVGLVELRETTEIGRRKSSRTRRLVSYDPGAFG